MPTPEQELEAAMAELLKIGGTISGCAKRDDGGCAVCKPSVEKAKGEIRRLFAARDCGHPERHCPVCDGSVEQCREFCRSAAEV